MTFTTAEKLQIVLLCDLATPPAKRELDFDFVREAVISNDIWALHWKYPGLELNVPTPPDVKLVCDILDMWERVEESFEKLSPTEKTRVQSASYNASTRFAGFDGNNESGLLHIARLLVEKLDRYSSFKHRIVDSHFPGIATDIRLLAVWRPIWDKKVQEMGDYQFTADELIAILREHIHPEHRQPQPGGGWTFDPPAR